jgi:hypothetical protein
MGVTIDDDKILLADFLTACIPINESSICCTCIAIIFTCRYTSYFRAQHLDSEQYLSPFSYCEHLKRQS